MMLIFKTFKTTRELTMYLYQIEPLQKIQDKLIAAPTRDHTMFLYSSHTSPHWLQSMHKTVYLV